MEQRYLQLELNGENVCEVTITCTKFCNFNVQIHCTVNSESFEKPL